MPSSDILVLGGGPNGLACAFRLAQDGARVTLLEAGARTGGGACTTEFAPGYRVSGLAHILHMLDDRVARDMALERHGLTLAAEALTTTALGPRPLTVLPSGRAGDLTEPDAAAWAALSARLDRFARVLAPARQMTPPRLSRGAGNDTLGLARLGLGLRGMGAADFREFGRLALTNVADLLEDELSDDRLRGLLAFDATLGAWAGPRSPGTVLPWLNRLTGGPLALPRGGMGTVAAAMTRAAEAAGVAIRTDARIASIQSHQGRASGVTLASGEVLTAGTIVSALCPKTTLEGLLGPRQMDIGTGRQVRAIRARGAAAKLHLALTGLPDLGADPRARMVIALTIDAVETAFNPVKYGEVPERPVLELILPTAHEPGLAPPGHHVLSAIVQFAPTAPRDPDAARAAMLENTLCVLEQQAPGLRALIAHAEILMPWDIAAQYGMAGGQWHHGELSVEQMFFLRPFAAAAQYESPLPGLWLGSAGAHPGGGISGAAGWNAAGRLLEVA